MRNFMLTNMRTLGNCYDNEVETVAVITIVTETAFLEPAALTDTIH